MSLGEEGEQTREANVRMQVRGMDCGSHAACQKSALFHRLGSTHLDVTLQAGSADGSVVERSNRRNAALQS